MEFSKEILEKVARAGAAKVSDSFSKLSKQPVKVTVSDVEVTSLREIGQRIEPERGETVIAYTQMIEGVKGASLLTMNREQALNFVDLLNERKPGSTGILMDLDRSAIKETLNILSNSFITTLSEMTDSDLMIGAPHMLPVTSLEKSIQRALEQTTGEAVVFKTVMEISGFKIATEHYVVFSEKFAELINKLKDNK